MTIRQIANKLASQGYDIRYRVRKDGGVLITKINNQRFTGATGNKIARQLAGESLSGVRQLQLKYATVKRKWKRQVSKKASGTITYEKVIFQKDDKGYKEALKYLSEKDRYATGLAYTEVVNALIDEINSTIASLEAGGYMATPLRELVDVIKANKEVIRDEYILPAYQELYKLSKTQTYGPVTPERVEEVARNVKDILRI